MTLVRPTWHALIAIGIAAILSAGCATEVPRSPTALQPIGHATSSRVIRLDRDQAVTIGTGYSRTLRQGSEWRLVGQVAQGNVFKPLNSVFTVEGAQVHEATLVVSGTSLVGFYLPVERAYVPATPPVTLTFSEGR